MNLILPGHPFEETVKAAKHCMFGNACGVKCPYYDRGTGRCRGDWRKDLLTWAQHWKEQYDRSRGV